MDPNTPILGGLFAWLGNQAQQGEQSFQQGAQSFAGPVGFVQGIPGAIGSLNAMLDAQNQQAINAARTFGPTPSDVGGFVVGGLGQSAGNIVGSLPPLIPTIPSSGGWKGLAGLAVLGVVAYVAIKEL